MSSTNTSKRPWFFGHLKEDFLIYKKGDGVFVRKAVISTPFKAEYGGSLWLLKVQGQDLFHTVAESYGGKGLCTLVVFAKDPKRPGYRWETPPHRALELNKLYREFRLSRPAGGRRYPAGVSRPPSMRDTVNI